ncbi:MAG: Phycobilisome 32.1 kDa linker polypeptide, phycocyanin-associated, rod 2 [Chroococcopsis gigantea SAG 12.99]|jgi:phycocyanin-associated rod linker protein|nr:phycobilisome linker polypeptide [Chlorogloea purpurea SAG 13.99]MDV2999090.1 Phycobilisome 32.1 kDa linker polypeptide, phycocyanin-associated, rod 2 [Chroococcopsis gigantea SAG 12.99]
MTSLTAAQRLGYEPYVTTSPVELRPNASAGEREAVLRAAYRQIMGNDYLMESERLISIESLFRNGVINVKDLVRALALSDLYRNKFFHSNPQNRFIELNYKHLLGRTPYDQSEIAYHTDIYNGEGYEAEINSYIDSPEYTENFGDSIVPYYRGFATQRGQKTVGFSRMFQMYRGYASSDRNLKGARLVREVAQNSASPVYIAETSEALAGISGGERGKFYRVRVIQGAKNQSTRVRRSVSEYLVPYEQLSSRLQQINRQGGQVISLVSA